MGGQRQAPAVLSPELTHYPLGGLQKRSGRVKKSRPPPRFDPRTVQSVASRYTDWGIAANNSHNKLHDILVANSVSEAGGRSEVRRLYMQPF